MIGDSQIIKMAVLDYTKYKVLAFDIYGTLIDWKGAVWMDVLPLLQDSPLQEVDAVTKFRDYERQIQAEQPTLAYQEIVKQAEIRTKADVLLDNKGNGQSIESRQEVGKWPAFQDSVEALQRLKKYFKIVAYSNVDHASFAATLAGPLKGVTFDGVYIAEDIGCYKPDPKFMQYLISHAKEDFGAKKEEILVVAHGLEMNHVPRREMGMPPGVWLSRGDKSVGQHEGKVELGATFGNVRELADTVEAAFEGKGMTVEVPKPHVPEELKRLEEKGLGGS